MKIPTIFSSWSPPRRFLLLLLIFALLGCDEDHADTPKAPTGLTVGSAKLRGVVDVKLGSITSTQVGITPFPPDLTAEADRVAKAIAAANGDLYTVQLDNGIPWESALSDSGYSSKLMGEWEGHRNAVSDHQEVYLAIAPLKMDRSFWADGYDGAPAPSWVAESRTLNDKMLAAYKNYALKAVAYFQPRYLNIGVEAGELAHKDAELWREMEKLFHETKKEISERHPELAVGISFTLPALMAGDSLSLSQGVIDNSDYVGISFYPYLDDFYHLTTGVALQFPPEQWREPLDWLSKNVSKPIAISETGYSSSPISVSKWNLDMQGSPALQERYVAELAEFARRDDYLFTVFFLSVDYDRLAEKLPQMSEVLELWKHTGFFDQNLEPKPAWKAYRSNWLGVDGEKLAELETESSTSNSLVAQLIASSGQPKVSDHAGPGGAPGLRWDFEYRSEFEYLIFDASDLELSDSQQVDLWIRSDRSSALLLQVEEKGGEAFFAVLSPESEWERKTLSAASFKPDPSKLKDGKIDWSSINTMMIADGAVKDSGATGRRVVELALAGVQEN